MDGGVSWTSVAVVGDAYGLLIDPVSPTTLYAKVSTNSSWTVLKSTDSGSSWIETAPPVHLTINGLAMDASRTTNLYATASDPRVAETDCCVVFKSTDGGTSWIERGNVTANLFLVTDPVTPATLYAGGDSGLFKSTDDGGNWVAAGPVVHTLVIDPLNPTTLYAARTDYTLEEPFPGFCGIDPTECMVPTALIYRSTDGGANWPQVATLPGRPVYALAIDPKTPTTLYAGGHGVLKSTDGGVTWSAAEPPPPPPPTDTIPPDTSITSAVDGTGTALANDAVTLSASLTFSFTGTDNVGLSRFECQLDGAGFGACVSPLTYNALPLGRHTFEARAVDTSSNVDGTPARYSWTIDAAPETTINSAIDGRGKSIANGGSTPSDRMTLRFTGTDNGAVTGFECLLDGASFAPCTSPISYASVSRGTHTFRVRAIDNNGVRDPSPAAFTWQR
jgi:hypothetical protein